MLRVMSYKSDKPDNVEEILENNVKILTDDVEKLHPINPENTFKFEQYSEVLADVVKNSLPKYSIGIYGEWGTGKTTLMALIERKLKPCSFRWGDTSSPNSRVSNEVSNEVRDWIKSKFKSQYDLKWVENQEFIKAHGEEAIVLKDTGSNNNISIKLEEKKSKAVLEINNTHVCDLDVEKTDDNMTDNMTIKDKDPSIVTVWFNAWRYESEENFALIPLMKTIAFTIGSYPRYSELRKEILRGLAIVGKGVLQSLTAKVLGSEIDVQKMQDIISRTFEQSPEFDKNAIYFEGLKKIQDEMNDILKKNTEARIVVFIDDLDRCSPENALEVFESLKVFLDIEGFVFVLGLSREALYKLIEAKFQKMGVTGITGEQYIRKIIQIEVQLPRWEEPAIENLIRNAVRERLKMDIDDEFETEIIGLIGKAVEPNPREVKRFLNRLIMVLLGYQESMDKEHIVNYLVIEVLRRRWKKLYDYFFDDMFGNDFRNWFYDNLLESTDKLDQKERAEKSRKHMYRILNPAAEKDKDSETRSLEPDPEKGRDFRRVLIDIRPELLDDSLWELLWCYRGPLRNGERLEVTRRISELSDITIATPPPTADADLRSRRRESYLDLWPRFKLLLADFKDSEVKYPGRNFVETYSDIRKLSERLQNWYYDGGGAMLMTDATKYSFTRLLGRIRLMLKIRKNEDNPIEDEEMAEIRKMVQELQYNMLKDMDLRQVVF